AAWREALRVAVEPIEALLDEADLIGLVVDREVGAIAEARRLAPQDAAARGVEREHPERVRLRADEQLESFPHLCRGLVRERYREDLGRFHSDRGKEVRDAVGEDARLAGPRAGDHEQR